ncbi:MAG: polymer-forming cytoskeletal protein [Thermoanaerobaculia bacterium]|nr:polymer-forming cytoskeletal protein [Thermoanaerobaculia bacterium]
MGLFGSSRANAGRPPRLEGGTGEGEATLVAVGTRIEGVLRGTTEVILAGEVVGEVRLDGSLIVGTSGRIVGPVSARRVRIAGQVEGEVRGGERVELLAGGSVEGNVTAPRVVVEEGGFLSGKVEMGGEERPRESERKPGAGGRVQPTVRAKEAGADEGAEPG